MPTSTYHNSLLRILPAHGKRSKVHKLGGVVKAADVGLFEDDHFAILSRRVKILREMWMDI